MFQSLVQSGFFAFFGQNQTKTELPVFPQSGKLNQNLCWLVIDRYKQNFGPTATSSECNQSRTSQEPVRTSQDHHFVAMCTPWCRNYTTCIPWCRQYKYQVGENRAVFSELRQPHLQCLASLIEYNSLQKRVPVLCPSWSPHDHDHQKQKQHLRKTRVRKGRCQLVNQSQTIATTKKNM